LLSSGHAGEGTLATSPAEQNRSSPWDCAWPKELSSFAVFSAVFLTPFVQYLVARAPSVMSFRPAVLRGRAAVATVNTIPKVPAYRESIRMTPQAVAKTFGGQFVLTRRRGAPKGMSKRTLACFHSSSAPKGCVSEAYDEKVAKGQIKDDPAQREALVHLDRLYNEIVAYDSKREDVQPAPKPEEPTKSSFFSWFQSGNTGDKATSSGSGDSDTVVGPRGLYIYGGPGSGKTFSMELFYATLPIKAKRRVHFHEFMLQVHRMLHSLQKRGLRSDDMMNSCVDALYKEGWVLCFDEFQVTDIADAMVIRRLFQALLDRGMVIVITSNREPDELYKNGIQRDLFIPFIEDIKTRFDVFQVKSKTDYRMLTVEDLALLTNKNLGGPSEASTVYFSSSGPGVGQAAKFERLWNKLTEENTVANSSLRVQGRKIRIPLAAADHDVARFTFDDLCAQPRGAADYYAIASTFHTIFVDEVPQLSLSALNPMRRFITMIDTFYDHKVVLVINAKTPMDQLLNREDMTSTTPTSKKSMTEKPNGKPAEKVGNDSSDDVPQEDGEDDDDVADVALSNIDEAFAFDRTLSRLHEMNRSDYLQQSRERAANHGSSPVRFLSQVYREDERGMTDNDIEMLWNRYDMDNNGVIDQDELKSMLEEITLFKAGHKHVPEEVFVATRAALLAHQIKASNANPGSRESNAGISRESFQAYFKEHGLVVQG